MSYWIIKILVLKDWYLYRWTILSSLAGGALCLAIISTGGKAAFLLGVIGLVTVLIAVGAQLVMSTTVLERKEQTMAFVMSMPISYREYTAAKILGNVIIFLVPWIAVVLGSFALILVTPGIAHGLIPYVAIMAAEILVSTCFIITVAVTSESQGWTIGAIMAGNLALNGFGYYVAHVASIARGMEGSSVGWTPAASGLMLAELVAIVLLLGGTFFYQSRKRDFL